jgi:hypothetical protein
MKDCSACKESKPLDAFFKRKDALDGREGTCKECRMKKKRANPNFKATTLKANIKQEKKRKGKRWGYNLNRNYGMTEDDYWEMFEAQEGCCDICRRPPQGDHYNRLVVDHNHKTGTVRGLLCNSCNVVLGHSGDNAEVLRRAAEYLKENGSYGRT